MPKNKKIILVAVLAALLLAALPAHRASADGLLSSAWDCVTGKGCGSLLAVGGIGGGVIGNIVFVVNYIMAVIAGAIIAVEVWAIEIMLQINEGIVSTPFVQAGYGVVLSLANLGFVLGIIVIGIATILRSQTYGIKQILWKLVVMAILVNFGLVIGGVFINLTNTMTRSFISSAFPGKVGEFDTFATSMANIFQPQDFLSPNAANTATVSSGTLGNDFVATIFAMLAAVIGLTAIVVVLGTLVIMLAIRYVYLSILLILLPLAWLMWVFPNLRDNFQKWWHNFIRWSIFPPVVVFFLWLVVQASNSLTNSGIFGSGGIANFTAAGTIANFLGQNLTPIIQTGLKDFVIVGLSVGGLIAANSLGIKGASAGISAVKGAAGGITGYVGKKGKQAGRAALQTKPLTSVQQKLQAGQYRIIPKRLQTIGGRLMGGAEYAGGGELVEQSMKKMSGIGKRDPQELARLLQTKAGAAVAGGGITKEDQMAGLRYALENKEAMKEVMKNDSIDGKKQHITQFLKDNESRFKALHQEKLLEGLEDETGLSTTKLSNEKYGEPGKPGLIEKKKPLAPEEEKELEEKIRRNEKLSAGQERGGLTDAEEKELGEKTGRNSELRAKQFSASGLTPEETREKEGLEKSIEELQGRKTAKLTDAEKTELSGNAQRIKELKDKKERGGLEDKDAERLEEINQKLSRLATTKPDTFARGFKNTEKEREALERQGKPVPTTLDTNAIKNMRQAFMDGLAKWSPTTVRGIMEAVSKDNNLDQLETHLEQLSSAQIEAAKNALNQNKSLLGWFKNNPGRVLVNIPKKLGMRVGKKEGEEDDEDEI